MVIFPFGGEFYRVLEHVPKHLLQADLIGVNCRMFRAPIDRQLDSLRIDIRSNVGDGFLQNRPRISIGVSG